MNGTLLSEMREYSSRPMYLFSHSISQQHCVVYSFRMFLMPSETLHTIDFDVDEYDIKGRLTSLIDK